MIGLRRSGSVCLHFFFCLRKLFVFALQALLPLRRCPFFMSDFFGSHAPRVFPLPSFRRAGWRWAVSGCHCVASRVFSSPPARLGPAGRVEEPLVARSGHASSLLSPRSIHGLGIQELLSCSGLLLPVLSRLVLPPHLCTLGEVLGRENLRGVFLCSRLPLPPHLCTLGEVVGRVSLPSAAPVRVLPGLPIFGLESWEGTLSPLLVEWLSCAVLLLTLSLCLPCSVQRSECCGRGSSRLLFSLVQLRCDRWRSTDR